MKTSSPLLVASLLLSAALSAQSKPCLSMNDSNNNSTKFITGKYSGGPGYWALKWTTKSLYVARAMTIFTGNQYNDGFHRLEIWSHDAKTKLPGQRLSGGTFFMPGGSAKDWVGTNLDKTQVLTKGTTYWFVWSEGGWSGLPHATMGTTVLPLARKTGAKGAWRQASSGWAFKFRLFCNLQDQQTLKPAGKPCSDSAKRLATSFSNTPPKLGNRFFRIEGTGVPSGAASLLLLGGNKAFTPLSLNAIAAGCYLNTDVLATFVGKSGTGDERAKLSVGATNHVTFGLPIPNSSSLKGAFLGTQIAVFDLKSKNPLPLVFTNGLQITFF